jgi:RND family efflux transporter MFP subunit
VVSKTLSDPGDVVVSQVPVAVVVDINNVIVKTSVIEKDFGKIRTGLSARVQTEAYPGKVFEGKISEIAPTLDEFSHTANIEIKIPNPGHILRPGMYARIQLVVASKENAAIIPKSAVFKDEGDDVVFLISSDLVKLQRLELGYYDLKNYEVLSGLEPGQLVVASDQAILQDGTKVTIARKLSPEELE